MLLIKETFGTGWQLTSGISYGYSNNKIKYDINDVDSNENAAQLKLKLRKHFSNYFNLSFGADYFITKFNENFDDNISILKLQMVTIQTLLLFIPKEIFYFRKT